MSYKVVSFALHKIAHAIRENHAPDRTGPHANFTEECVACALLSRVAFEAKGTVYQELVTKTGIHNADGSIHTGHYENWLQLSQEERKIVNDEHSRLGASLSKVVSLMSHKITQFFMNYD